MIRVEKMRSNGMQMMKTMDENEKHKKKNECSFISDTTMIAE